MRPLCPLTFEVLAAGLAVLAWAGGSEPASAAPRSSSTPEQRCERIIKADVVALEQAYVLNRFSAYVPAGMLYALRRDVVSTTGGTALEPGQVQLRASKRPRPLVLRANEGDCLEVTFTNLLSPTQEQEGGLPRENGGRLPGHVGGRAGSPAENRLVFPQKVSVDAPRTRAASFHLTGLSLVPIAPEQCPLSAACGGNGSNVGLPEQQGVVFNPGTSGLVRKSFDIGSLARPGQTVVTRWRAATQGTYFAYSTAAPVGGEGDGGQIGLGLFAAVNVEPANSRWYRSQVTHEELRLAQRPVGTGRHPYRAIDYDRETIIGGRPQPILGMLDRDNNIVHSDLNAIVVINERDASAPESPTCLGKAFGSSCNTAFREFTVIFHDEVHAEQAFAELADENNPLSQIRDGMGINYGVSSMGSLVMSTPQFRAVGPAKDCPECRAEEFFLSSWANGDPALILAYDESGRPVGARYPDDPSNVHHSYLGDPVRFRNIHAGPKETHVFHLHAHQWVQDSSDPNSTYLDSQTISPGATFSYSIEYGGAGNRNYTPGDSIFHCHLYPHFAQGMWELWRVHDAFVDGRPGLYDPSKATGPDNDPGMMNLPDAEVKNGIESPAVVPIPGIALAPMPTETFRGYPFYIPGIPGHRPPQPPLDMDVVGAASTDLTQEPQSESLVNGGLPRHVVSGGKLTFRLEHALQKGGEAAQVIAQRVAKQDPNALAALAKEWDELTIKVLKHSGEQAEQAAMSFHEGSLSGPGLQPVAANPPKPRWWEATRAYRTDNAATTSIQRPATHEPLFYVNSRPRAPGAPYANPCPLDAPERDYRAAFIQTELVYNKHGWFDPQGRIVILEHDIKDIIDPNTRTRIPEPLFFRANSGDCINFKSSNFVPSALNVDDFQIYTPTDTIGQHIHLVKFDVTSSDGSGNGFNYEDATFSPEEVRERIFTWNRTAELTGDAKLKPRAHPLFRPGGDIYEAANGDINHPRYGALLKRGLCPEQGSAQDDADYEKMLRRDHPLCGAQRTSQRWWADPILNTATGKDKTLRTVFTHDHMGPSSHQQHGLYAGLVIEPANSVWTPLGARITPDDLAAAGKADRLNCGLPAGNPGRSALCDKLIGGANLASQTAPSLRWPKNRIEGVIEPRPPLRLRADGGPTATMANVIAPRCIGDSDSNPLQPALGRNRPGAPRACDASRRSYDTRREFAIAIADFGIAYNMALEPINPEPRGDSGLRDNSAIRFGRRHVALTPARPLGISSEDPGSQYVNYRHEPLALRLSERAVDRAIGGWNYRQASTRANLNDRCAPGDQDCLGDPANAFSTGVHARRDEKLAKEAIEVAVLPATRDLLQGTPAGPKLDNVLAKVQAWRKNFNCMLYPPTLLGSAEGCPDGLARLEPWRVFGDPVTPILPVYEGDQVQLRLIQGAQEAQHIFSMNGVKWPRLPGSNGALAANGSGYVNTQTIGISEHFEFDVIVNPLDATHTDYLYFGSSIDQLWDGLWGVMRSFSVPRTGESTSPVATSAGSVSFTPESFLAHLGEPVIPRRPADKKDVCATPPANAATRHHRAFDVSAVRVCELFDNCGQANAGAIEYSKRFGIRDEKALVYVLEGEMDCTTADTCDAHADAWHRTPNASVLKRLRAEFASGRPLEPLVLRAAAGQCIHVNLRNHLPPWLDDGPVTGTNGEPAEVAEAKAYHNFLPMITDGFNINQFRMSSTVGLSPARVAQHPLWSDGSNVGLNGAVTVASADAHVPGSPFQRPADQLQRQGSLVPPCIGRREVDGPEEDHCKQSFVWSATDFRFDGTADNRPVEFGALPLRSFGDPLKHPAHGLAGALVIGPEGSRVCSDDRFGRKIALPSGEEREVPGGLSAEICRRDGRRYVDHVLVMQDAVHATRGGLPLANLSGAEEPDDYGVKALNYRTEPLWARGGNDPSIGFPERNDLDFDKVLSSAMSADGGTFRCVAGVSPILAKKHPCDPETPVMQAWAGETVRLNVVHPGGHTRQQGLALSAHAWNPYPWSADSRVIDSASGSSIRQGVYNGFGPMMGISLQFVAGGERKVSMDYLFRTQASFLFDGGIWGILRVEKPATQASRAGSAQP